MKTKRTALGHQQTVTKELPDGEMVVELVHGPTGFILIEALVDDTWIEQARICYGPRHIIDSREKADAFAHEIENIFNLESELKSELEAIK